VEFNFCRLMQGHYIAYAVEQSTAPIGKVGKKQWLR